MIKQIKNKSVFSKLLLVISTLLLVGCKSEPKLKDGMAFIEGNATIKSYWLDVSPVTVAQFRVFVKQTHFKTQAEIFGNAGVFDFKTGTWGLVAGANWEYPFGKKSGLAKPNHPVTQVSWNDANAYCKWAKKRLPSSEEFIFAEKNGIHDEGKTYTWGDDFLENKKYKTNFWQGNFPYNNTVADGFLTTSPVGYFGANQLGLMDIEGNVWQWCSDDSELKIGEKNQRGGSFLCDPMVCHGFKTGGISSTSAETSLCHSGFRCARSTN